MSDIIRSDDNDEVEVFTRGRGRLASSEGLQFLKHVDKETAAVVRKALFENSALQAMAPSAREMAAGAAATVVSEMRQGATEAEAGFELETRADHWEFFGLSASGDNVRIRGHMWARSNKRRY